MNSAPASPPIYSPARLDYFLRSDSETLRDWLVKHSLPASWFCTGAIILGAGAYGAAVGSWREGWQAFTGIKVPLVILLTHGSFYETVLEAVRRLLLAPEST